MLVVYLILFINQAFAQPNGFFGTVGNKSGSEYQRKKVGDGTHSFQGSYNNERLLSLGLHATQKEEFRENQSKRNKELINSGTHVFQTEEFKKYFKERQKEKVKNGTHHLLSGNIQRKAAKELLAAGLHTTQIRCSCIYCNLETSFLNFAKYHGDKCKQKPIQKL